MNLRPGEDAALIKEAAERFLADQATAAGGIAANDPAIWSKMAEMGWLALQLPEDNGGLAATSDMLAVIAEALGRFGVRQPFVANVGVVQRLLMSLDDAAASSLAEAIGSGERRAAFVRSPALRATREGDVWRLDGQAMLVAGGDSADAFLIAVGEGREVAFFLVEADQPGLERTAVETVDGSDMADLVFHEVALPEPLPASSLPSDELAGVEDQGMTLLCAEAVGAIETLLQATVEHVGMREQFGKPLRAFQVVDHAVADMRIALEEARTAVRTAVSRLGASPDQSGRSVSAAMAKVACLGRRVAHHAIQFHGAMGVTDELAVGDYAKRLLGIACELGTEASALDRFASLLLADRCWSYLGQGQSDAVDGFALDEQTASFRVEVADWLDGNLPAAVAEGQRRTTAVYADAELAQQWHKLLYKRGWAAPNWPKEFGGTGWNAVQRYVWAHETAMRFAPITSPLGLPLVGPVLFHYGTAEQQARYLPPIVSGEELWCQGFSEPGAGSDLAALSTRAVLQNDCYVVNGTKIWTTQGHEAQMMAALVRTGAPDSRREGISFLLIDMQSPGVEIRPIRTIGGDHELNQIFFDDVRVPVSDRVGAEGQGWEIARFLLEHERGGDIMSGAHRALLRDIHAEAVRRGEPGEEYRRTVARIAIDIDTLEAMELFVLLGESKDSAIPSILKLRASEIQQAVTELGVEVLGSDAIRWVSRRPLYGEQAVAVEDCFVSRYLNSRANTIFGGAREIQKTLIARTVQ